MDIFRKMSARSIEELIELLEDRKREGAVKIINYDNSIINFNYSLIHVLKMHTIIVDSSIKTFVRDKKVKNKSSDNVPLAEKKVFRGTIHPL